MKVSENPEARYKLFTVIGGFFKSQYLQDLDLAILDAKKPEKMDEFIQNLQEKLQKQLEIPEKSSKIKQEIRKNYNSTVWLESVLRNLEVDLKEKYDWLGAFKWTYNVYAYLFGWKQYKTEYEKFKKEFDLFEMYKQLQNKEREERKAKFEEKKTKIEEEIKDLEAKMKQNQMKDRTLLQF